MSLQLVTAGTVPGTDTELVTGEARLSGDTLHIDGERVGLSRGTAAMIGAACAAADFFKSPSPQCIIGGDIGRQNGSRKVYRHLIKSFPGICCDVLCLHYIVPDIALHNQMTAAIRKARPRPVLIADAGFMYVAKAAGQAAMYDLFLPDLGELAFLADDKAMHPAYTRGFLTSLENDPKELIARAAAAGNIPPWVCVKGGIDHICHDGAVVDQVDSPSVEALEAIGGTGDTVFGMAAALVGQGRRIPEACRIACRANRVAGLRAGITPADRIAAVIEHIPNALAEVLQADDCIDENRSTATR